MARSLQIRSLNLLCSIFYFRFAYPENLEIYDLPEEDVDVLQKRAEITGEDESDQGVQEAEDDEESGR